VLTEAINWHWIFFINVPIAILTAFLATRLIDSDQGIGLDKGADTPGALLITASLMLGVYTIVKPAAEQGWGDPQTLGLGAVSLALLFAFIIREARAAHPIMPLRIFRSRNVTGANVVEALLVAGMFGTFFLGSLYMEQVLGYDPLEIGLAFLPATLIMGTLSVRYAEPLITRFGARRSLVTGMVLVAISLALFTRAPVDGGYVEHLLPVMILLGFGIGVCFPALMSLAMSGATQADAGLASGLVNTSAQVGGAIGLAVLATLSATRSDNLIADGEATASALTGGYHLAFWIGAGLVIAAIGVALAVLEPEERAQAELEGAEGEGPAPEPAYSEAA
jgi:MFS family permease